MSVPESHDQFELDPYSARVAHAYETAGPAVASVIALNKSGRPQGQGSGVVFTPDGYLLTNSHVAAGGEEIQIALPGGVRGSARVVGDDPENDVEGFRMVAEGLG